MEMSQGKKVASSFLLMTSLGLQKNTGATLRGLSLWVTRGRGHFQINYCLLNVYVLDFSTIKHTWWKTFPNKKTWLPLSKAGVGNSVPSEPQGVLLFVFALRSAINSDPRNQVRWINCVIICFNWSINYWETTKASTPCGSPGPGLPTPGLKKQLQLL